MKGPEQQAYRAALAMNNMAVKMIKFNNIQLAVATLNDSMKLMKAIFHPTATDLGATSLAEFASERLDLAIKRSSENQEIDSTSSSLPLNYARFCDGLEVSGVDDEDLNEIRAATLYGPSTSIVFPMLIRSFDHSDQTAVQRKFGMILYNHGMANWLLARELKAELRGRGHTSAPTTKGAKHAHQLRYKKALMRAYRSLSFSNVSFSQGAGDEELTEESVYTSTLLSAMSLNCISQVLQMQNEVQKAEETLLQVSDICSALDSDMLATLFQQPAQAAPAA